MAIYEAHIMRNWQEHGLTQVLVFRHRATSVEYAGFVVDIWCLGVKDAMAGELAASEVACLMGRLFPDGSEPIEPHCARKLIEGAVAYAERLGFAPHRDYRKARRVLSGLDADECDREFVYGKDGRPFYMQGAESDETANRVLARLDAVVGHDGYDYAVTADEDEDGDGGEDVDVVASRDYLLEFLRREPESVPRFFAVSGMITAAIITPASPRIPHAMDVMRLIWPEKTWPSQEALEEFMGHLQSYWNSIAEHVTDACRDDADKNDEWMVDVWDADCPDDLPKDRFNVIGCVEWCGGFIRALETWPQAWEHVLTRPEVEKPLALIRAYAEFIVPENRERVASALGRGENVDAAVLAIARAARPELR